MIKNRVDKSQEICQKKLGNKRVFFLHSPSNDQTKLFLNWREK